MLIGIPREIMPGERRVAATPQTVKKLVQDGAEVWIERGAGEGSYHHDADYAAAGARIEPDVRALFSAADVILKVKEPQMNRELGAHEIDLMHTGQVLLTFIHPASPANHDMVRRMAEKGVTGLTLDGVPLHILPSTLTLIKY